MFFQTHCRISTPGRGSTPVTAEVAAAVRESGLAKGLVNVFVRHTSCSLIITENADPDVRRDLESIFGRLAPDGDPAWRHDLEGPDDMAAHARSVLSHTTLTIPFRDGRLQLGPWQGVYLWEHRCVPHTREILITVLG